MKKHNKKINYHEFPKFTQFPTHRHNVHLSYLKKQIDEYVNEYGLNLLPDFQRGHVWTMKQRIAYVEFILMGGDSGKDIYFNHPGWSSNFKGDFVIVDGLQRITTLLMFVNDEIPVFGGYVYSNIEGNVGLAFTINFHVNDLPDRASVLQWYLEMNGGGTPHTKKELDRVREMLNIEMFEIESDTVKVKR
jgi:hypothetical protein